MKKNLFVSAIALAAVLCVSGCSTVRDTLGIEDYSGPDEFDVATAPPLSIPPDYTLRPPEPGAPRPQAVNPQDTAKDLLSGTPAPVVRGVEKAPLASNAEDTLLQKVDQQAGQQKSMTKAVDLPPARLNQGAMTDSHIGTTLNENARLQGILEAPVTRNEAGKYPTIDMTAPDKPFWDSWF